MIDRAKAEMIRRQATLLIGLPLSTAIEACEMAGCRLRVVVWNGVPQMKTNDTRMDRINVVTENDIILSVGVG